MHVILLVASDGNERTTLQRALQSRGYRVLTAANSSGAVEAASSFGKPINLLLADARSTGTHADLLVREISRGDHTPALLVVSDRGEGEESDDHKLFRPFTPSQLARKISLLVRGNQD